MEVITIESKAYQELMQKINQLIQFSSEKPKEEKDETKEKDEWLDSNAVCQQLNISLRTLYRLQKERLISYSTLRGRYRYKKSDVEQVLHDSIIVASPETLNEMRQSFPSNFKR